MASTSMSSTTFRSVAVAKECNTTTMRAAAPMANTRSFVSSFKGQTASFTAKKAPIADGRGALQVSNALSDLRDRIESVKNTQKITDAMRLVAAAKVRRAQAAVIGGRPFSEELVRVLYAVNERLAGEDIEVPLTAVRPVKTVLLVSMTGDRGLCGGFNSFIIKKTVQRAAELEAAGIKVKLLQVGKKGSVFFKRRTAEYDLAKTFDMGGSPTIAEAQAVSDEIYSEFVSENVDKVELIYTKFINLIKGDPVVQTLLPLTNPGELMDASGNCVDIADDEVFKLTSKDGELAVEREAAMEGLPKFEANIKFEQDPAQILDALLPLYMSSQVLRAFQESVASELAARMSAMSAACDNAKELKKTLSLSYNRQRQAKITAEIIELCAGAQ